MIKSKIYLALSLFLALISCTKNEAESSSSTENAILFGIEDIAQTKVVYGDQTNGGISAQFEKDDQIGLYAYYNNFYYYYTEYLNFAESVIFTNQGLTVDADGTPAYSPLKSWTFSTLYGTAPHTLDCIAYYPFKEGYNDDYVNLVHSDTGAATLEYYYYTKDEDNNETINSEIDFMTAHTRYDDSSTPDKFRDDMLNLTSIPLSFTRQTASLNFKVTKPEGYETEIVVKGVTLYFDAYQKFTQTVSGSSSIEWSDMTTDYALQVAKSCTVSLDETSWDSTPEEGSTHIVDNLLENDDLFYIPPKTEINKIVFTIIDDGVVMTYTWHPHIATIEANTHYTLNLELDPARAN